MSDSVNVYVVPGPKAVRLSRLTRETIDQGVAGFVIECTFPNHETKAKKPRKKAEKTVVDIDDVGNDSDSAKTKEAFKKLVKNETKTKSRVEGKSAKKEPNQDGEDAKEDLRDLGAWDEPFDDEDEEDNVFGLPGMEDESDSDPGSSERENGWKLVVGSAGGRRGQGASKARAIVLSD
jgi:hypothetical protein